ncbi:MAG: M14 family metallopeptidase [Vicinamibacterales bacterium]
MRTASPGRRTGRRASALIAAIGLALMTTPMSAADAGRYQNYEEMTATLKALASKHPDLARLEAIGKTPGGRSIWAMEIANRKGKPPAERPAVFVAANFEGDHLVGSQLALSIIEGLLSGYAADATVKQRLDENVFYVLPRVNPDGAELMFAAVKEGRRTNLSPFDADNDGRVDEDGCEDLNKDGFITLMRVKDPKGAYMISPEDPRLMRRAEPSRGEAGAYSIYWEGIDNDNDGFFNEDGPGGVDINRNFQHQYPYYQPEAGFHMVSEAETRAVLDYVLAHRNIAVALSFGESDNLIVPPTRRGELGPAASISLIEFAEASVAGARQVGMFGDTGATGFGGRGGGTMLGGAGGGRGEAAAPSSARAQQPARRPNTTIAAADIDYFTSVSEKYRELTGIRSVPPVRTPAGAFFEYAYYQYGVPSFSTPGWSIPTPPRTTPPTSPVGQPSWETLGPGGPREGDQGRAGGQGARQGGVPAGRGMGVPQAGGAETVPGAQPAPIDLRVLRWMDSEKVDGFVAWTPFKHPSLGDVEIGGFKPYATTNPPAEKLAELGASHAKFVLHLSSLFAKVRVAKTEVTNHGGGVFRIKAEVENAGFLPTALAQGVTARSVKPVMVQLGVEPGDIIAGDEKTNFIQALAGSGGRESYEWLVKGKPGQTVTLKVVSQKGGSDSATLRLQ